MSVSYELPPTHACTNSRLLCCLCHHKVCGSTLSGRKKKKEIKLNVCCCPLKLYCETCICVRTFEEFCKVNLAFLSKGIYNSFNQTVVAFLGGTVTETRTSEDVSFLLCLSRVYFFTLLWCCSVLQWDEGGPRDKKEGPGSDGSLLSHPEGLGSLQQKDQRDTQSTSGNLETYAELKGSR